MRHALFQGRPAPVELVEYQTARAFWREMGVRLNVAYLDDWPEEKINRYQICMHEVDTWEETQMELARRKAAASGGGGR